MGGERDRFPETRHSIPGVGYAAYFTDSEGNTMGVYEDDPSAE